MDFQEAENRFQELEQKWASGQLDQPTYRQTLATLRVNRSEGESWRLQEHTGRWLVLRGDQWFPAERPGAPRPASQPQQPALVRQPARPQPPALKAAKKTGSGRSILLFLAGFLGAAVVCVLLGTAGYLGYTGRIPLPPALVEMMKQQPAVDRQQPAVDRQQPAVDRQQPAVSEDQPAPEVKIAAAETTRINADGTPHSDTHGVSLSVPVDALKQGEQVILTSSELDAPWVKTMKSAVSIDTPFYRLEAQGKNDTPGSLTLNFPATNSSSRVLAVIDNEYLVELAQAPVDGKFTLQIRAGPADTTEMTPPQGYDGTGSIYYAVISPKSASQVPSSVQMVDWHPQDQAFLAQADERNCIPDISVIGGAAVNLCRQNPSGTVQVMLPTTKRDLVPQVDLMVDKIEAVMKKYYDLGFTAAQLTHSSPMLVRVSTKVTSPSYYPLNGVLYIPVDTVSRIATLSPTDVYHEMAHWIQAVKYSTRLAYWSGEKTWWLETSAENMVMLIEPAYMGGNLTTYGTITNPDNTLAFQSEPYQWPGDYYIQAQLLKVNLCDSPACPLSPASFAKAISEGTYPLMDGAKKSLVSANMKDYAYYLLGKAPTAANSAIPLIGPVATGEGYGEYVHITRNSNTDLKYDYNGAEPQMRKESQDGKDTLVIEARIQRDGVYPLVILGGQGNNPGLPVELIIDPGAPFYYTIDDGPFQYSSGGSEIRLTPIHGQMGIKKVRIVAVGENGGEVFKARVQPVDLQGTWVVAVSGQKTGGGMSCSGSSNPVDNPDGTSALMAYLMEMTSGMGDMAADPTGRSLDYSQAAGRVPQVFSEANVTFNATALLAGDGIKYQATVDVPKGDSTSAIPPVIPVAAASFIVPAAWLGRKRLNMRAVRVFANVLVIAFLVIVSTGCFGMGMYGNATLDAKVDKLEYVGGQDTGVLTFSNEMSMVPTGAPIWKMTGSGTYTVTFMIEATVTGSDGKDTTEIETCTGAVTYPVIVYIYKDFNVVIPSK